MNKSKVLILLMGILPVLCFATTGGDETFSDIYTLVAGYVTGSLGQLFIILGFIGAGAAIAGFAPMKVMFPVLGLALAMRYGPGILNTVFAADGKMVGNSIPDITLANVVIIMAGITLIVIGIEKNKRNKKAKRALIK